MFRFSPVYTDPSLCTHINFAFAFVTEDGSGLRTFEWNDVQMYSEVIALKQKNNKLKVVLSVGGWTHGTGGFSLAASSSQSRMIFANNALQFITKFNFDGIDID